MSSNGIRPTVSFDFPLSQGAILFSCSRHYLQPRLGQAGTRRGSSSGRIFELDAGEVDCFDGRTAQDVPLHFQMGAD